MAFAPKIAPGSTQANAPAVQSQTEQEQMQMQENSGNESSLQKMHAGIQAKLNIGKPGDKFEQEADNTAARVMSKPQSNLQLQSAEPEEVQQMTEESPSAEATNDEEGAVSTKSLLQPLLFDDEKDVPNDMLNAKEDSSSGALAQEENVQAKASREEPGVEFEDKLNNSKGGGEKLPADTQGEMENRFGGKDFSNVRVHTDSASVDMNKDVKSKAFTNENHIFFNSGQFSNSDSGKELLAHELTHTIQQGATEDKVQAKTNEGFHQEDGDIPDQNMKEKQEEEYGDDLGEPLSEDEKKEGRPEDTSEAKKENQGEIEEEGEAKPPVDRKEENAPKISESVENSKKAIEEKPEPEEEKEPEKIPEEKKELTLSQQAAVFAAEAFSKADKIEEPKEEKPVDSPKLEPITDQRGEELPPNPMLIKVPLIAGQIQLMRDKAHEQELHATEEERSAEEMRGSIQTIYSKIYDSNDYLDLALERTDERKILLEDLDVHLVENEKRTQKVGEEAPRHIEGTAETKDTVVSSADVSEEQEGEGEKLSDPDMEEESENTAEQTEEVREALKGTPEHADVIAQTPHQLIEEASIASEKHALAREQMTIINEKIAATEADLNLKKQYNASEKAKLDQTVPIPDEISKEARKLKKRAQKSVRDSEKREDKLNRIYKRYVNRMKGTPAAMSSINDSAAGEEQSFIQRTPEDGDIVPGSLTDEQKAAYEANREEFMVNINNDYEREMIDLEMSLKKDFVSMDSTDKRRYALKWTRLHWSAILSEINWVDATVSTLFAILSPPHTLAASWQLIKFLLFPAIPKDDPVLLTSLRLLTAAVSIVSVIYGTLLALSTAGFIASYALSLIPWFFLAMFPWIFFFKFQMVTWGGLFLWWTIAAAVLQAAVFLIDLRRATVSESADALQANSNQLAADTDQAAFAVSTLGFMKLFKLGGRFLKYLKNRRTGAAEEPVANESSNTKKSETGTAENKTNQVVEDLKKSGRVDSPGQQMDKYKSYTDNSQVPERYRRDTRFEDLAKDPAHNNATKPATRAEAMAGLETESQGLVKGPIERGPAEIEFYDGDGNPWDVKTPVSPTSGQRWTFNPEEVGAAIKSELSVKGNPPGTFPNKNTGVPVPRKIILDATYLDVPSHKALWRWLKNNLTSEQLSRIVEVNTKLD